MRQDFVPTSPEYLAQPSAVWLEEARRNGEPHLPRPSLADEVAFRLTYEELDDRYQDRYHVSNRRPFDLADDGEHLRRFVVNELYADAKAAAPRERRRRGAADAAEDLKGLHEKSQ
jgi:hypothetical protein